MVIMDKSGGVKTLSKEGKLKLFRAIEECINMMIDLRTLHIRPHLNQEEVEKRCSDAKNELFAKIDALEWRLE